MTDTAQSAMADLVEPVSNWFRRACGPGTAVVPVSGVRPDRAPVHRAAGHCACRRRPHARARLRDQECKAVALVINSPAARRCSRLDLTCRIRPSRRKKLPVLVFVDVAASGGYMLACAGDEVFSSPVRSWVDRRGRGSFGFQELIKKVGIERRLYTAGEHKAMLDPSAGKPRRRRARQGASARDPRPLHCAGETEPRRQAEGRRQRAVHR